MTCGECEDGTCICGIPGGCPECLGSGKCGSCMGTMDVPDATSTFVQHRRRLSGVVGCETCQRKNGPLTLPLTFDYGETGNAIGALIRARRALRCQGCHREIPAGKISASLTYRLEERVTA